MYACMEKYMHVRTISATGWNIFPSAYVIAPIASKRFRYVVDSMYNPLDVVWITKVVLLHGRLRASCWGMATSLISYAAFTIYLWAPKIVIPLICAGIILDMGSANGGRHYYVTPSRIGRARTQTDP